MDEKKVCQIIAQFDSFRTTKDGGGKLSIEFGQDANKEIQKILNWNAQGIGSLAVVITPADSSHNIEEG